MENDLNAAIGHEAEKVADAFLAIVDDLDRVNRRNILTTVLERFAVEAAALATRPAEASGRGLREAIQQLREVDEAMERDRAALATHPADVSDRWDAAVNNLIDAALSADAPDVSALSRGLVVNRSPEPPSQTHIAEADTDAT